MNNLERQLRIESLEPRRLLANYLHSASDDFHDDFVGGLPQNNPNGDWAYFASNGTTGGLVATNGSSPVNTFGVGAGWADSPGGIPSYARGGVLGLPANTIVGHGPQKVTWTAPAEVELGAIEISGLLTQHGSQPTRQMQMRVFKNDSSLPFLTVDANFVNQTAIVPLPTRKIAIDPGDTLTIVVDGSGPQGDGVSTFASWDVEIEEVESGIDADFNGDFAVDASDLLIWQTGFGLSGTAMKSNGDADGDKNVDGSDFLLWQRQFGNSIDSGIVDPVYNPSAVIVQTSGVTLPDGTQLDLAGTQTQGLQEAFDYAADFGWGTFVLPGTYNLDAHLDVDARQGAAFRLQDVTMNFGSSVTDFGLRFDSTMITDWYWDGGALNAPNATDGIRFEPRSIHPLDGIVIPGSKGVVDSRFHFNVDITAASHKVTMDSADATINEIYFHFQDVTESQINYIGGGFADTNTFPGARTDLAIPWDLFSTSGRVTVNVPDGVIGNIAQVFKPDGTLVDTTSTTTSGLQEAFDFAAANNLDVLVFGRGVENIDPFSNNGLYNTNDTLTIGNLFNRTYRIYNVTFNYTGTDKIMVLHDLVSSDFELTGQVVANASTNNSVGVLIQPLTTPLTNSTVRIEHVPVINDDPGSIGVEIDPSFQTIENSEFYFTEVLGGDIGIRVNNPSAGTFFRNNLLSTLHTHDWKTVGLELGTNSVNSDNLHSNTVEIHTNTDGGPANTSLQVWGDNNTITLSSLGTGQSGPAARLENSSTANIVTHFGVNGPLIDLGVGNSFVSALVAASSSGESLFVIEQSIQSLAGVELPENDDPEPTELVLEPGDIAHYRSDRNVVSDSKEFRLETNLHLARDYVFSEMSAEKYSASDFSSDLELDLTLLDLSTAD